MRRDFRLYELNDDEFERTSSFGFARSGWVPASRRLRRAKTVDVTGSFMGPRLAFQARQTLFPVMSCCKPSTLLRRTNPVPIVTSAI